MNAGNPHYGPGVYTLPVISASKKTDTGLGVQCSGRVHAFKARKSRPQICLFRLDMVLAPHLLTISPGFLFCRVIGNPPFFNQEETDQGRRGIERQIISSQDVTKWFISF